MKKSDFAKYLTSFFTDYLACERGVSQNTIRSYSDTFILLLNYMNEIKHIKAENMTTEHLTRKTIVDFLSWLQEQKQCKDSTRNQRLAAIHAFSKYMQYEDVIHLEQWELILSIKVKKTVRKSVNFLSIEGVKLLLSQIPSTTKIGYRDLAMLALLYDSGARVQEVIDLRPVDLHLSTPYYVTLFGKGGKKRLVPLQGRQVEILKTYMSEYNLEMTSANQRPLFQNCHGRKLTGAGVTYILAQYAAKARVIDSKLIPEKISPHCLRHSKAMHLLQAGINLIYIRDILGHVSIQTTEIYAKADSKQKREALEAAYVDVIPGIDEKMTWEKDSELKMWLKSLGR